MEWYPLRFTQSGSFPWGAVILTWIPSMHPMAHGKPPTQNKPCLISSLSPLVDRNMMKSPNFAVKAHVTRCTTRLTVDLLKPKNVSPITWRNEPKAKNLRVIKTCISAETAWLRFVFLTQAFWLDLLRENWSQRDYCMVFQQSKLLFRWWHKFSAVNNSALVHGKAEMMKFLDVWDLVEILSKKRCPVIGRYSLLAIVRCNQLGFVYSCVAWSINHSG